MLNSMKNQRGDTIVEVLIAIVVISMVLVAGYITTSRSVDGLQDTEEHSEALQLAQTQLEYLHNSTSLPSNGGCYDNSGNIVAPMNCFVNSSDIPTTAQPQFDIVVSKLNASTYSASVTWPSIANSGVTNNVTLYYQP